MIVKYRFTVEEPSTSDNSTAFFNKESIEKSNFFRGQPILIKGKGTLETVAVALTNDECKPNVIQINSVIRKNLGVKVGDTVVISKSSECPDINKVSIAPYKNSIKGLSCDFNFFEQLLKPYFSQSVRPLHIYDSFTVTSGEMTVEFRVDAIEPGKYGVVTNNTEIYVNPVPYEKSENDSYKFAGYKSQLEIIKKIVALHLHNPQAFELGVNLPHGILLHGPSGCGKTLFLRAIADEIDAQVYFWHGQYLFSKIKGETEKNIRYMFESSVDSSPCIILFDDIDSIAMMRDKFEELKVIDQLCSSLDDIKDKRVILIATTNKKEKVDPRLLRPGRLDFEFEIGLPNEKDRQEIFKIHSNELKLADDVDFGILAKETEGYTCARIASICSDAIGFCINDKFSFEQLQDGNIDKDSFNNLTISMKNFSDAIKNFK